MAVWRRWSLARVAFRGVGIRVSGLTLFLRPMFSLSISGALLCIASVGIVSNPALAQEASEKPTTRAPATAQIVGSDAPRGTPIKLQTKQSYPVLVFDRARVLSQSLIGLALEARIEAERAKLLAENDKIYADLEAEEQLISDQRAVMSDEVFRDRASKFDEKVTGARAEQDEKARKVQALYDSGLEDFEKDMNQVLTGVARDLGATLVFERQQVYLMSGSIDVSKLVIDQLDALHAERNASAPAGGGSDADPGTPGEPGDASAQGQGAGEARKNATDPDSDPVSR